MIPPCGGSSAEKPPWTARRPRCEMERTPGEGYVAQYAFRAADYARSLDIRHVGLAYATRIPAIRKNRIPLVPTQSKEAFNAQIPPQARWKADNYNHLLEQPTLFYAVTLSLVVLGASGAINTALAWSYVALRIAHSLVQATTNVILIRFSIFIVSSIVLLALTLRAAMLVY